MGMWRNEIRTRKTMNNTNIYYLEKKLQVLTFNILEVNEPTGKFAQLQ